MNQPYGGFPGSICRRSPSAIGPTPTISTAISPISTPPTLADVQAFFKTYYVPNNAVLLVLGDVKADEGIALATEIFRRHSRRSAAAVCRSSTSRSKRKNAAATWKKSSARCRPWPSATPSRQRRTADWYAMALLDQALHGGRAGRIYRELVLEKQIAVEADGGIDDIFGYNGPTQMVTRILHKPEYSAEQTLAAFDAVIREMQDAGHQRRRTQPAQSEMALRLFFHAGRRPRRHAALRPDAPARLLHALRQRSATA